MNHNRALIIGVGADLPVTVADAEGLAGLLADPGRCQFDPQRVTLLTGPQATREAILRVLEELVGTPEDASVVVYFSGHGIEAPDYYLLPYGYNIANLAATCIAGAEFSEKLRVITAKRLLVLLDTCHAGGLAEAKGATAAVKSPLPPQVDAELSRSSGRVVIASSRKDEYSLTGRPYSVFTAALLEGLAGYGAFERDGYARVLDVAMWVGRKVPERTQDRQHPILKISNLADNYAIAWYAGGAKSPQPLLWAREPVFNPGPDSAQARSWQRQLANYRENLLLIEERMSEYVMFADVPLQLTKNQRQMEARIIELEQRVRLLGGS